MKEVLLEEYENLFEKTIFNTTLRMFNTALKVPNLVCARILKFYREMFLNLF